MNKEEMEKEIKHLNELLTFAQLAKRLPVINKNTNINREILVENSISHFSNIGFSKYKKLKKLEIKNLNKINIFSGLNNSGKSSLLEAIFLLASANDINALFEIYRRRGKFHDELDLIWFYENFNADIILQGNYDNKKLNLIINKTTTDDTSNKNNFLTAIQNTFTIDDIIKESKSLIFENKNETFFKQLFKVCNVVYSTPFSNQQKENIVFDHNINIKNKSYQQIIEFLRKEIDNDILNIDLTGELKRFIVEHNNFDKGIDLTHFGEGMQRVFHIALQFATAKNGILLIDEFENGIHYTLLEKFALFTQKLADEFNVQVFITTHSKECIQALLHNKNYNDKISYFNIVENKNKEVKVINYTAESALENMEQDIEVRGW